MSIECGECERDLRGGHDETCSRYKPPTKCICTHMSNEHDEEGECKICICGWFRELNSTQKEMDETVETISNRVGAGLIIFLFGILINGYTGGLIGLGIYAIAIFIFNRFLKDDDKRASSVRN